MIFKLKFADKTEWAQAKNHLQLLQGYEKEHGSDFQDIQEVTEISDEEAKTIMLTNNEHDEDNPDDFPAEISLFDMVVGDDFVIVGSSEWD